MKEFEDWLEEELGTALGSIAPGTSAEPAYRTAARRRRFSLASAVPLAVGTKVAAGLAVAALAAGGTATVVMSTHVARGGLGQAAPLALVETVEHAEGDLGSSSSSATSDESQSSTDTASSTNHGALVTSAVASCKAASSADEASESSSSRTTGDDHGIGQCVANVASDPRADRSTTTSSTSTSASDHGDSGDHPTPPPDRPTPPPHP